MVFIVIDGIDTSGKSVVAKSISLVLKENGYDVYLTEEPTRKDIGLFIRNFLKKDHEFNEYFGKAVTHLFVADRFYHQNEIQRELKKGKIVISDRYYYSTFAYQTNYPGVTIEWLKQLHKGMIKPDLVIIVDVDIDVIKDRLAKRIDKNLYERVEFLKKVKYNYLKLKDILPDENIHYVDNSGDFRETIDNVVSIIEKELGLKINYNDDMQRMVMEVLS